MGAVTYPNPEVDRFIAEHFVPVQYNVGEHPEAFQQFNAAWTPTIIIQDVEGREHRRSEGYLDPQRFLAEMSLALVKAALNRQEYEEAARRAEEAVGRTKGDKQREPEALYWKAVVAYRQTGSADPLLAGWNRLLDEYPDSEWAKRAEFIRQPKVEEKAA